MYIATCLEGLSFDTLLRSNIYIEIGGRIRLYRGKSYPFTREDLEKLKQRGTRTIYISDGDWRDYIDQVGDGIDEIMESKSVPLKVKARILRESTSEFIEKAKVDPGMDGLQESAVKFMKHTANLIATDKWGLTELMSSTTLYDHFARHSSNVCFYSTALALAQGAFTKERVIDFSLTALLHDIGLMKVPASILRKTELSREDWEEINKHSDYALEVLAGTKLGDIIQRNDYFVPILQHHERPDGKGYPKGLKGDEIHPLAAILSLTSKFDGMTTDWSKGSSSEGAFPALKCILEEGGMIDNATLTSFIKLLGRLPKVKGMR